MVKIYRWVCLLLIISTLTGCFSWIRVYQTYLQMDKFDKNFVITSDKEFGLHFNNPVLYSDDFTSLSKIQPSLVTPLEKGKSWQYRFQKVDKQGEAIKPEIKFYFNLNFNAEDRLTRWSFSPLFLQIAPAEILEISLRSIGGAKINKEKRQLKADTSNIKKIITELPKKQQVIDQLGRPLVVEDEQDKEIYVYHFLLDSEKVEEGYEDRLLSIVKLSFDKKNEELIRMAGRFAGLKVSINYQKYVEEKR